MIEEIASSQFNTDNNIIVKVPHLLTTMPRKINRTHRYLAQILLSLKDELSIIGSLNLQTLYIEDTRFYDLNDIKDIEPLLFFVIAKNWIVQTGTMCNNVLAYDKAICSLTKDPLFIVSYSLDTHHDIIVMKVPKAYYATFYAFIKSTYSKMYTLQQLRELFQIKDSLFTPLAGTVLKQDDTIIGFIRLLKERFGSLNLTPADFKGHENEIDFPIVLADEVIGLSSTSRIVSYLNKTMSLVTVKI